MKDKEFKTYANSFQAVAKLRLESITLLMEYLGNPQDKLKFIHVAGTNGKGSVCCFLQNILTNSGYKTGKYTSPNMLRVNERISIDGNDISDVDLDELLKKVHEKANLVKEKLGDLPTQFEIWTAAAFCWFYQNNCDYVVLETGLGGRKDATNVIKNPVISVITRIAKDHTEFLGETLSEIAAEKAGIIKETENGGVTVTLSQEQSALEVISSVAKLNNNKLIITKIPLVHDFSGEFEVFDYDEIKEIKTKMLGLHQAENASLAIECAKALNIPEKYILSGILKAKNPGRMEIISDNPLILFDGAHNKNGMTSLVNALDRYFSDYKKSFVIGFMKDKDIKSAVNVLKENGYDKDTTFYTVMVKDNPRADSAENLAKRLSEHNLNAIPALSITDAIKKASQNNTMIVICGSLYLYKDFFDEFASQDWQKWAKMLKYNLKIIIT